MGHLKENTKELFTKENIGTHWNNLYRDVSSCLDYHFVLRRDKAAELVKQAYPGETRVLDLGCGAGVLSEKLIESGYSVDAADMSEDMLGFTRARLEKYDESKFQLFQAECEDLPFEDSSYDVVACIGVFGYMDDVDAAVTEILRVIKPGGTLIMSIRNINHQRMFDIYNWLRLIFYKIPKKIVGKIVGRRTSDNSTVSENNSAASAASVSNDHLINIWDRPKRVQKIFEYNGFVSKDFYGEGYGPITYKGKNILHPAIDKRLSASLTFLIRLLRLEKFCKWYADISLYVFSKPAERQ